MNLVWLLEAKLDVERLYFFLVKKSPDAAEKSMILIDEYADRLFKFPELGAPMNDGTGRRRLFIPFGQNGYEVRYIIEKTKIVIFRVWHGKEERM